MTEDQTPGSELSADMEPLTLGDASQMVTDLVQLIEAKALAQRLAFKTLVEELSGVGGPETAFRIQARLDAMRCDPALLGEDDSGLRESIGQELSLLIEELDGLVASGVGRGAALGQRSGSARRDT